MIEDGITKETKSECRGSNMKILNIIVIIIAITMNASCTVLDLIMNFRHERTKREDCVPHEVHMEKIQWGMTRDQIRNIEKTACGYNYPTADEYQEIMWGYDVAVLYYYKDNRLQRISINFKVNDSSDINKHYFDIKAISKKLIEKYGRFVEITSINNELTMKSEISFDPSSLQDELFIYTAAWTTLSDHIFLRIIGNSKKPSIYLIYSNNETH
jgi:hypothetical protein